MECARHARALVRRDMSRRRKAATCRRTPEHKMETSTSISTIEAKVPLSPWQLFWQRLKRRRIAMVGGVILIVLYLVALFAGFVAPYSYQRLDNNYFFHPPIWPRLQGFHLVVPRYEQCPALSIIARFPNDTKPLHFFVRGDKYKLFGLIPATIHLFGTGDQRLSGLPARRGPIRARRIFAVALRLANFAFHRRHRHFAVVHLRHDHRRHFRLFQRLDGHGHHAVVRTHHVHSRRFISSFRCAPRFRRA